MFWDNHKLTSYIATLRYMVHLAKVGEPQVHDFLRGRMKASLGILDSHLQNRSFAIGDRRHCRSILVRLSLLPDEFGISWSDYPGVEAGWSACARFPAGCTLTS